MTIRLPMPTHLRQAFCAQPVSRSVWAGLLLCLSLYAGGIARAQHIPGYNYDEAKVPSYMLLNPLRTVDGSPVQRPAQWPMRRAEIVRLFEQNVFGRTPPAAEHAGAHARVLEHDEHALNGLAVREQVEITFDAAPGLTPDPAVERRIRLLLYVPRASVLRRRPAPVVLGMNFNGNQSVVDDPGILPTDVWSHPRGTAAPLHTPPDVSTRGSDAAAWQVAMLLQQGYAVATFYYQDLEPDSKGGLAFSARHLFSTDAALAQPDAWGAIGLWAWGLSRAMDYLQLDPLVDAQHVAVFGHSRLGKAADWAAAQDLRFAAVLSNESGHGGQSIQRRALGETVYHLEHSFPYWFCPAYARWVGHDTEIPADGNLLLSLVAPRPLYVASAEGDEWSDPKGEFLSAVSASRVYTLLGERALAADTARPAVGAAIGLDGLVAYHERTGKHDVTAFDWQHYLEFLSARWGDPLAAPAIGPAGLPPPPLPSHPATRAQVRVWRTQIAAALHLPESAPALDARIVAKLPVTNDVVMEKLTYATAYGLRVPAVVYRPAKPQAKRLPAIVIVNGHGGDKSSWYAYYAGVLYARAGAVVLTYDPIGEGERNDAHQDFTGEHDQLVPSPQSMPTRMGGLMVTDVMQAVATLAARPDVDPHRIAVLGFSMGSFIASVAGAVDPRIHALFLTGGGDLDGSDGYWDAGHAIMCQAAPYKALRVLGDRGAVLFTLSARRGDTFVYNGTADTVVAIPTHGAEFFASLQRRVLTLNGGPHGVFTYAFDEGASHRPSWVTPLVAAWLNQELRFPAWRGLQVSAMPTIRIGDWAAKVGLSFGKSSAREDRDAGLQALEADVPLLTAEQLDVFSRQEWEQVKAQYVYASWLDRAAQAAGR